MNCLVFLQYGLHDDSVKILPYAFLWIHQLPRKSCFIFIGCTNPTILLYNFARHNRSQRFFQFLTSILDGFFEFLILRVNEIDPSQFSCVFKMELFHSTIFAPPSAWHSFPLFSRALAIDDLAWMSAVFSSISPRTTFFRQELFLPKE